MEQAPTLRSSLRANSYACPPLFLRLGQSVPSSRCQTSRVGSNDIRFAYSERSSIAVNPENGRLGAQLPTALAAVTSLAV